MGKATEVAARNSTPMFVPYSTCLVASTKEVDRGAYQLSVRDSRQHWYRFIRREHDHPPESVFTDVFTMALVNANLWTSCLEMRSCGNDGRNERSAKDIFM